MGSDFKQIRSQCASPTLVKLKALLSRMRMTNSEGHELRTPNCVCAFDNDPKKHMKKTNMN
eukprot:4074878-Amphidinium_carterae.1